MNNNSNKLHDEVKQAQDKVEQAKLTWEQNNMNKALQELHVQLQQLTLANEDTQQKINESQNSATEKKKAAIENGRAKLILLRQRVEQKRATVSAVEESIAEQKQADSKMVEPKGDLKRSAQDAELDDEAEEDQQADMTNDNSTKDDDNQIAAMEAAHKEQIDQFKANIESLQMALQEMTQYVEATPFFSQASNFFVSTLRTEQEFTSTIPLLTNAYASLIKQQQHMMCRTCLEAKLAV